MSSITLNIKLDGDTPGLSEHRLSLKNFSKPLKLLYQALNKTAQEVSGQPSKKRKSLVDFQIEGLHGGCVQIKGLITSQNPLPISEVDEIPEKTLSRILGHIENHKNGRSSSSAVSRFINSLPKDVRCQEYSIYRDGEIFGKIELEEVKPLPKDNVPSKLLKLTGHIIGVKFPPSSCRITLQDDSKKIYHISATEEQIDKALTLRSSRVDVMTLWALKEDRRRLLWIRPVSSERFTSVTPEVRLQNIMSNWSKTLEDLAK